MLGGALHVITGLAFTMVMFTAAETVLYLNLFVGVNVVFRAYVPAESTVPGAGL